MGKKRGPVNEHERIVAAFARNSMGASGIFHPDKWPNRHEPADIVILVGRSLFLCNLSSSVRSFEKLCEHNLRQAKDRIKEWKTQGYRLKGKNDFRDFDIAWDEIDQIAVVSVIDGPNRACSMHSAQDLDHVDKVSIAFTITTKIIGYLAKHGGGPRELLQIAKCLIEERRSISEREILKFLERILNLSLAPYISIPDIHQNKLYSINNKKMSAYDAKRNIMLKMRHQDYNVSAIFCELDWIDISFIAGECAIAMYAMEKNIPGQLGVGSYRKYLSTGPLKYGVYISESLETATNSVSTIKDYKERNGLSFIHHVYLALGSFGAFTLIDETYPSPIADELKSMFPRFCAG